jgi:hypothetical protein
MWAVRDQPLAMIAAATGNAVFFILFGFRQMAEQQELEIEKGTSDIAKLLFLEVWIFPSALTASSGHSHSPQMSA